MTRGKIRGRGCRLIKCSVRGTSATPLNMPTVPTPISNPQQGGTSSLEGPILGPSNAPPVQTSHHSGIPAIHFEPTPTIPNQRIQEGSSTQSNTVGEDASSSIRGGEKKRRVVGLGSPAKYYEPNRRVSYESDASSLAPPPNTLSYLGNVDELVMQLVPALLDHMLPVLAERVREMISSQSQQPSTRTDRLSAVAPDAPPAAIAHVNELRASGSNSDHNPSA